MTNENMGLEVNCMDFSICVSWKIQKKQVIPGEWILLAALLETFSEVSDTWFKLN